MRKTFQVTKLILLVLVGVLSGLYGLGAIVMLIQVLMTHDMSSAGGISMIAAYVVPPCIGLIICHACFKRVLRKSPSPAGPALSGPAV
jgi:hypothetical protein